MGMSSRHNSKCTPFHSSKEGNGVISCVFCWSDLFLNKSILKLSRQVAIHSMGSNVEDCLARC